MEDKNEDVASELWQFDFDGNDEKEEVKQFDRKFENLKDFSRTSVGKKGKKVSGRVKQDGRNNEVVNIYLTFLIGLTTRMVSFSFVSESLIT